MGELSGKVALVTGSSRSIGAEIVKTLAGSGAAVVVNSRGTREELDEIVAACRAKGVEATGVNADVSTADGCEELSAAALKKFGRIDILVNNVGVSPRVKFLEMTFEDWQKTFDINLNSCFRMAKLLAPAMMANKWGRIINMSGHAYIHVHGTGVHTKASKAAIMGLTRGLAGELAPYQITANHIAPSMIDSPPRRNKYYRDKDPSWDPVARGVDKVPLKRLGKMSEMAGLVRFLCSEDASYLTGQTYLINGGLVAI